MFDLVLNWIPDTPILSGFYSLAPFFFILLIVYVAAVNAQRRVIQESETVIDYLQGMIDSGERICYICKEPDVHANHPENRPGNAYSTSAAWNERQMAAYKLPPTTEPHDYFDARLVPYRFDLEGERIMP